MPANDDFYRSLEPVHSFESLADPGVYAPLPADWHVVVADVMNSTMAIQKGNYKAVNTVGVSIIAATLNIIRPLEIPYVFGGDGALLCIPPWAVDRVKIALSATLAMSVKSFGLILRAAVVPASHLRSFGTDIQVARHRVSDHYVQCALFGGGPELAEEMLKEGTLASGYLVKPDADASADYTGLECRWQEVRSVQGETIALIVRATVPAPRMLDVYRRVIQTIASIYGNDDQSKPVTERAVRAAFSYSTLRHELRLKNWKSGFHKIIWELLILQATVLFGWLLMKFGLRFNNTQWGDYKKDLVANTDYRKFDGALRLVLSGSTRQREQLVRQLSRLQKQGDVRYGIHVSDSAIMTCLVEQRQSVHFHFIDAAGGGYASAARILKGEVDAS